MLDRYLDDRGREVAVALDDLVATLELLGHDLGGGPVVAAERLDEARRARVVEPVVVAWDGRLPEVEVRPPGGRPAEVTLDLADGGRVGLGWAGRDGLPLGVHRLVAEGSDWRAEATVLAAPRVAWTPPPGRERRWGMFLPLYALRTERSRRRGIADLADLGALFDWLDHRGGDAVVSLPLLAAQLDRVGDALAEYSPYAPLSRRAWNELYADLDDLPGATASADPGGAPAPGADGLLDYPAVWAWKRERLAAAAGAFFAAGGDRDPGYRRFVESFPLAARYARFRAVAARHGADWRAWPERLRHPDGGGGGAVGRREPGRGRALPPLRPVGDGASAGGAGRAGRGPRPAPRPRPADRRPPPRLRRLGQPGLLRGRCPCRRPGRLLLPARPGLGVPAAAPRAVPGDRSPLRARLPRAPPPPCRAAACRPRPRPRAPVLAAGG